MIRERFAAATLLVALNLGAPASPQRAAAQAAPNPRPARIASDETGAPSIEPREDVDARTREYLIRHGDNGVIDAALLLRRTREIHDRLERERRTVRTTALSGSEWISIGPTNGAGRMLSVATDPSVPGVAIVGSAGGGAWKTSDGGQTWTPLTETIPNLAVGAVAVAPSSPSTIYLGTGEAGPNGDRIPGIGLLVSTDGGMSWQLPSSVLATGFHRISVSPANPQELVVGTNAGAFRSTNGFDGPWTMVIAGGGASTFGQVADLLRDPSNANVLYAATWDGLNCARTACGGAITVTPPTVLKSADGGKTWSAAAAGLPVSSQSSRVSRISLAIAPSSTQTLYASLSITDGTKSTTVSHIYRSLDGGGSWSETALAGIGTVKGYLGAQAGYDNTLAVSPNDPNAVLAGGVRYVKTADGGQSWSSNTFGGTTVHVDAHDLRYDAAGTLFIANDGGIWTSPDQGAHATQRNSGLVTRQFYFVANDPANRNRIFGGLQDNGTIRRPDGGGTEWDSMIGADGIDCAVSPAAPSVVFGSAQNAVVMRTMEGGAASPLFQDVSPLFPPNEVVPFFTLIAIDPADAAVLYTPSYRVWRSIDAGDSWVPLPTATKDGTAWPSDRALGALAVSRSDPRVLMVSFIGTSIALRTEDGGATWTRASGGLPNRAITGLTIDPHDPRRVWATFAGLTGPSVYATADGGGSWSAAASGLPSFSAQSLIVDPADASTLYCGTDVGVYRSTDGGASWSRFGSGMPAVAVDDLKVLDDGSALRAATHGRGMWELSIGGVTNHQPVVTIAGPASELRIKRGESLSFSGSVSDPDAGDSFTAAWIFPDTWATARAAAGTPVSHTFNRAGRFPVTLRAVDAAGAIGAADVEVEVEELGDSCGSPIVIPGAGPFPWTATVDTTVAGKEASDPGSGSPCNSFASQSTIWFSFTPESSGTYEFSFCGSRSSGVLVGYAGPACGPYTPAGICLQNPAVAGGNIDDPQADCASAPKTSATLEAGTTIRLAVWNFYFEDQGSITMTVTRNGALTPVIASVSPAVGSSAGGLPVVIRGSGFVQGMSFQLGVGEATAVNVLTPNLATATTPPGPAGIASLLARLPDGRIATLGDAFVYEGAPPGPRRHPARH